ncbi:MAG: hydrogenase maturation protease [Candidatus Thermoplasmatota archaeon]|nr:hydrogenase maturation protease [Candidatus Thermoplasmatota archaeon]
MRYTRIAVIGIGNPLMGDDGIGPRLIEELKLLGTGVELIDIGTGGMQLVHVLAGYDAVLLIDAADMGVDPGEFRVLSPENAVSVKECRSYSLHDWDIMRSIEISNEIGEAPQRILILAIQPGSLRMGEGISPEVESGIPRYIGEINAALDRLMLR